MISLCTQMGITSVSLNTPCTFYFYPTFTKATQYPLTGTAYPYLLRLCRPARNTRYLYLCRASDTCQVHFTSSCMS